MATVQNVEVTRPVTGTVSVEIMHRYGLLINIFLDVILPLASADSWKYSKKFLCNYAFK
jgi:hypothetical protein